MRTFALLTILTQLVAVAAFSPSLSTKSLSTTTTTAPTTALHMANDDDNFMKWARAARYATDEDVVVKLPRPLGLVLNQDPAGNVYVEKIAPKGNAARTGLVSAICTCVATQKYQ